MYEVVSTVELVKNSTTYPVGMLKLYLLSETFYCARLMHLATAKDAKQLLEKTHGSLAC